MLISYFDVFFPGRVCKKEEELKGAAVFGGESHLRAVRPAAFIACKHGSYLGGRDTGKADRALVLVVVAQVVALDHGADDRNVFVAFFRITGKSACQGLAIEGKILAA